MYTTLILATSLKSWRVCNRLADKSTCISGGGGGLQIISLLEIFDSSKRGKKEGEKILSLLDPVRREKEEGRWNK